MVRTGKFKRNVGARHEKRSRFLRGLAFLPIPARPVPERSNKSRSFKKKGTTLRRFRFRKVATNGRILLGEQTGGPELIRIPVSD